MFLEMPVATQIAIIIVLGLVVITLITTIGGKDKKK